MDLNIFVLTLVILYYLWSFKKAKTAEVFLNFAPILM